ncbi:MAG: nuclear transport factor 2 family protein [Acidobacteriota bacterium]
MARLPGMLAAMSISAVDLRAIFGSLSAGDPAPLLDRLAEDCVLEFPGRRFGGRFEGKRAVRVFLKQNQRLFRGGLAFDVVWAGVAEDRAIVQWTNAGTTRDGRPYGNRGVTILRIEGGLVKELQDYLDTERLSETWPREPA